MARLARAVPGNAPGDLFVDDACISCDTCRRLAPATFGGGEDDRAFVALQPAGPEERRRALVALVSCPVAAIGSRSGEGVVEAAAALPEELAPGVLQCGYAAESSFGAAAWLLLRPEGNVLVDSPRFARPLAARIRALGGIRFLVHQPVLRTVVILLSIGDVVLVGSTDLFIFRLQHDLHQSARTVGFVFGLASAGTIVSGVLTPRLRQRVGFGVCWIGGLGGTGLAVMVA